MLSIRSIALIIIISSLNCSHSHSQSQELYNWFDEATGKQNSLIHNGPVYFYLARTRTPDVHPFFEQNAFTAGNVLYDGQWYYNQEIKYDIHNDLLILSPSGAGYYKSISLIEDYVSEFQLNGRRFVNLSTTESPENNFAGYHEEAVAGDDFRFYIKHSKVSKEIIYRDALFTDYRKNSKYLLFKDGTIMDIGSKKSVQDAFPELKKEINTFFSKNRSLEKDEFMRRLFTHINSLLN